MGSLEQKEKGEKTDDYNGNNVIDNSRPPERRPLERHLLVPIILLTGWQKNELSVLECAIFQSILIKVQSNPSEQLSLAQL